MNSATLKNTPTLSERLNSVFERRELRAHGPLVIDADDLVVRLSPAIDPENPFSRSLSLSGGFTTVRRPAFVRVILSMPGHSYPWCEDMESWVVQDLGLLPVGDSVEIELEEDGVFHIAFAEPSASHCTVTVNGRQMTIGLPAEGRTWSCEEEGYSIAPDPDLPGLATVSLELVPVPRPRKMAEGPLLPVLAGGGTRREPIQVSAPLSECPLGLIRVNVYQSDGLLGKKTVCHSLFPLFFSGTTSDQLSADIPVDWAVGGSIDVPLEYECVSVNEQDLSESDYQRIKEILKQRVLYGAGFPANCLNRLQSLLQNRKKD